MAKDRSETDEPMDARVYPSITPEQLEILGPLIRELALLAAQQVGGVGGVAPRGDDILTVGATPKEETQIC